MKKLISSLILAFAATVAFAPSALAGHEEKVSLEQVPAKVKETIQKHVADGKITEIEKEKKDDGTTVYEVEYKTAKGEKHELKIGEDGKLLKKGD
ncbi:MAG: hypothetical protein BGO98_15400 [Myxococcales bacterium 68-20]|nr:PepSY-like domain-containing protein [Myxococcales bacterium]OJY31444.1 MAG: hypothetical protein BGO98_15400 [Myxococcales bacterium 68-20]